MYQKQICKAVTPVSGTVANKRYDFCYNKITCNNYVLTRPMIGKCDCSRYIPEITKYAQINVLIELCGYKYPVKVLYKDMNVWVGI